MPLARTELVRLLKIHREIARGTYPSLTHLAELCGIHPRTTKRDLRMLREQLGAPLEYTREYGGYRYTRPFSLAPEPFSEQEMLALSLTMEIADTFRNTPFAIALKGALHKLRLMQPGGAGDDMPSCISCVADPAPPEQVSTIIHFNELLSAIERHQQVRMTYYTIYRDAESTRTVDPYHLYFYNGMWYLYGWCHLRQEPRDFAVARIRALSVLPGTFTPPSLEAIKAKLAQRFANVNDEVIEARIWFDAEAARWVRERVWHPSQRLTVHSDGSCTLTMTGSGQRTIVRWVLGFGQHARVLAPAVLADAVAAEIHGMAAHLAAPVPVSG